MWRMEQSLGSSATAPSASSTMSCVQFVIFWSYRVFFFTVSPRKDQSTNKLIWARLGVTRMTYVYVDSPNLGSSYLNFLGEAQW